jgi:hypothetical protein
MKQLLRLGLLAAVGATGLAACGSGHDGGSGYTPPVVIVTTQDNFGTSFAQIFNRDPTSNPTDPVPDDAVPPLTLTAEPIAIP